MPDPGVQRAGSSASTLFDTIKERIGENLEGVRKDVAGSLNNAENLGGMLPKTKLEIDPLLASAIDQAFVSKLPDIANSIFEQSGLAELLQQTQAQSQTKQISQQQKTTSKSNSSATQNTNKPVETASKDRAEGRSNFEQLFLDLINGQLDVQL